MGKNNWTKLNLSKKSGLTEKTLSRILKGETETAREDTVAKIAKALETNVHELTTIDLQKQVEERIELKEFWKEQGSIKKSFLISVSTLINYDLVQTEYGLTMEQLVAIAPLLFTQMAEQSLNWRKEKFEALEAKIETLSDDYYLPAKYVAFSAGWEDDLMSEQESIAKRDLFGDQINTKYSVIENRNPFVEFLKSQISETTSKIHDDYEECPDFVGYEEETPMGGKFPSYNILPETLNKIFGDNEAFKPNEGGDYNYSLFSKLKELPKLKARYENIEKRKWATLQWHADFNELAKDMSDFVLDVDSDNTSKGK